MKTFLSSFVALTALLTITSAPTYAQSLAQNIFVDRPENVYPMPGENDVLHTLGTPSKSKLPSSKFKFLVWNLHKGGDEGFKPEYLALSFNRDIIMNQEIFLDENMLDVFRYKPTYFFQTATSFFSGSNKIRTGVANIAQVEPDFVKYIKTETLEPVVNSPKVTLITSYPIRFSKKKLTVVNIHGINFVTTRSFVHELNRIYEEIKDIPSPMVFAGDFNTWNPERIRILNEYAQKLGMEEATFLPDNRLTFNGYPLDHFYHTSDLKVTSARVDYIYKGSDHKPLLLDLEFIRSSDDLISEENRLLEKKEKEEEQNTQPIMTAY